MHDSELEHAMLHRGWAEGAERGAAWLRRIGGR